MLTKQYETEHVHETNPELAKIRRFTQRDLNPEEVYCGALKSCNTKVDRSGERFTKAYLQRFAETLPGKPLLLGHNYNDHRAVGRIYDAAVFPDGDHLELKTWYFTRANHEIVPELELGIQRDCSIAFDHGIRRCDLDGKTWLPNRRGECKEHQPLQEYDGRTCTLTYCDSEAQKAVGREMSLVLFGCQYDAYAVPKGLWIPGTGTTQTLDPRFWPVGWSGPAPQENDMDPLQEAQAEITRLKGLTITSDREKALQAELDELKPKAALIADGEKYHAFLVAEILKMADALDVANNDAEKHKRKQYEGLIEALKGCPAATLEAQRDSIAVDFNARFSKGVAHAGDGSGENGREKKSELLERFAGGLL